MFSATAAVKSICLQYEKFGEPKEVLRLEEVDIPEELGDGEVLVKLIASPVHPSDMGMITGKYGALPQLPAIGGREGLGEVVKTCPSASNLIGKRVKFPFGAWRSAAIARVDTLFFAPDDIDVYQASMAFINPLTAWMILHTICDLKPGDWIIQNAANSAVGMATIEIAKSMGIGTINLVRDAAHRREDLISCGATLVFEDETFDSKSLVEHTGGNRPLLGLNSVGGNSAMNVIKSMAIGGEVVTFGGAVGDKVRFPTRELIFGDVKLRGFWLDRWSKSQSHEKMQSLYDTIFDLIRSGIVRIPIDAKIRLSDGPAALISAYENRKNGKLLVVQ
ncbi:MAG: 2-enoyl thioester reductase domain-containing protein [Puniceicoccales bacterium]|nr:2-enoyl thioester reductase domain-containing protein [Puniceicoccales bacterium]